MILGIKWYHDVQNDDNHTFWLLSKHDISSCSATLHKCQMKQMPRS